MEENNQDVFTEENSEEIKSEKELALDAFFDELEEDEEAEEATEATEATEVTDAEEPQPPRNKIRIIPLVIVGAITLMATLCGIMLAMFAPVVTLAVQGIKNTALKQYTEAANAYQQMLEPLDEIELPEPFDIDPLRGPEYYLMKAISKVTRIQAGGAIVDSGFLSSAQLQQFPFSKFNGLVEEYKNYSALSNVFAQVMSDYLVTDESGQSYYEDVEKDPVFKAMDDHMAEHPEAPAWAVAIRKNYVGDLLGEPASERLKYFDGVKESDVGIEEYAIYLAMLYRQLDMNDDLIGLYDRRIAINHNDYDALIGKGKALMSIGDSAAAEKAIKTAQKYAKNSGASETLRIEALRRNKQYDEALKIYTEYETAQAAKESTPYPEAMRQMAIVYLLLGDYQSAHELAYDAAGIMSQAQSEFIEQALYLLALTSELTEDEELQGYFDLNENGEAILKADDKKAAIEKVFLEGKGDIS